jgi:hypothetical protein
MKIKTAVATLSAWMICVAAPLFAHHSFQSTFDIDKPVRIEGKVTQVNWGNPHVSFEVAVTDSRSGAANWRVELPSVNDVIAGGLSRLSISVGGDVAVAGYAAKSGERLIGAAAVTLKATGKSVAIPVEQSWKLSGRGDDRFYNGEPVNLTGRVVSMERVNPIPMVHMVVTIPYVSEREWLVETVSTSTLEQIGWKDSSLAPGDVIQVSGRAAMSGARKVFAVSVVVYEKDGKVLASPIAILNSTPLK